MVTTVTEVLNIWNEMGVFSYVIPFLLIFAVVFAILKKTKILGDDNDGILAIISVAMGLLALQFDIVADFYSIIFPRFGVGLSVFLVIIILVGFFFPGTDQAKLSKLVAVGVVIAFGVIYWSFDTWNFFGFGEFGGWFSDNFWAFVILGLAGGAIWLAVKGGGGSNSKPPK